MKKEAKFGTHEYFDMRYIESNEPWGFSYRASQQRRYEACLGMLKQLDNCGYILDIGCSQGQFTISLQNISSNILAIDVSKIAIQRAKKLYGACKKIKFELGGLPLLSYEDNQFDIVLALEVLYYLNGKDRLKALKEIRRTLKKDGFLLISVNINKSPYFNIDEFYNLVNGFFKIKKVEFTYGRIYYFFEKKLLLLDRTKLQKIIRKILSSKRLVDFGEKATKLILGRRGVTMMTILAQNKDEMHADTEKNI